MEIKTKKDQITGLSQGPSVSAVRTQSSLLCYVDCAGHCLYRGGENKYGPYSSRTWSCAHACGGAVLDIKVSPKSI